MGNSCGYSKKLIFSLLVLNFTLNATSFTYNEALAKFYELNIQIPKPDNDGRIPTLNNKGSAVIASDQMSYKLLGSKDYLASAFLEFIKGKEALEIGGCYGDLMQIALQQSNTTKYTLNDLDERHLFIAAKSMSEKITNGLLDYNCTDQSQFIQADISDASQIKNLGFYDAIYAGNVFLFLTPEQLELAVQHLFLLLKPNGRVYIGTPSPYAKFIEKFAPEYMRRIKAKEKNPSFIKKLRDYAEIKDNMPSRIIDMLDGSILLLDPATLKEVFKRNGFKILECQYMALPSKSKLWRNNNNGYVILIAKKEIIM